MPRKRECFVCGCTDDHACPGGCSWAPPGKEPGRPICTRCAFVLDRAKKYRADLAGEGGALTAADRAAFALGLRAALRLTREWGG